jgi:hypothetical protein
VGHKFKDLILQVGDGRKFENSIYKRIILAKSEEVKTG